MTQQFRILLIFSVTVLSGSLDTYAQSVTLFAPQGSTTTYLMDANGEFISTWQSSYRPGLACYLIEDRSLLRTGNLGRQGNSVFGATGGAGGVVELYDWDGSKLWSFQHSSDNYMLHHDVEYLPNGNILMIAWERKTEAEALAAGRNPSLLSDGELWPDKIIEVQPDGTSGGTIVWEWHVWDHLIQDHDTSRPNYGIVSDQPGKIDLNFVQGRASADWNHINAVDYNRDLDQILLTVHNFSEIWIIDHNTTTAQASGSAGDLLYRWGNPQAYGRGRSTDQQLFVPHDGRWIESGTPGEDDILIFNNGQNRPDGSYSSVDQFTPPVNDGGEYSLSSGAAFSPSGLSWTYRADPPTSFSAPNISGAQRLPDGNTLICDGPTGTFFEVTSAGETVWEYVNPFSTTLPQGESNSVFRAVRYHLSSPGDALVVGAATYPIVDTGQESFYSNRSQISAPSAGEDFFGQDAQYSGFQPSYTDNGDGTVTDNVTGLMWEQSMGDKTSFDDAFVRADSSTLGGHADWRVPTVKELYSLILFTGMVSREKAISFFIDTTYFSQPLGDVTLGEREIDAQTWSSTEYVGRTMRNDATVFGVNFIDGRIKGYPRNKPRTGTANEMYFRMVRGNTEYGQNIFSDNSDNTISDLATGLMWQRTDDGVGRDWQEALAHAEGSELAGYSDWRLPSAKELQSIVDYTRSPQTTSSPAIDPVFVATQISDPDGNPGQFPFYWTGTTHLDGPNPYSGAVYIAFGEGLGQMNGTLMDVHGAGCQRSDPKSGNINDYPQFFGPQGDVRYVYNYVRLVRNADSTTGSRETSIHDHGDSLPLGFGLRQNYPNPFNPSTTISFSLPATSQATLKIYSIAGQLLTTLVDEQLPQGDHEFQWQAEDVASGVYFYKLTGGPFSQAKRMLLLR